MAAKLALLATHPPTFPLALAHRTPQRTGVEIWTGHGGRLGAAVGRYGGVAAAWLDLSTGINPIGWDASGVAIDWRALPDEGALTGLESIAARYFGVEARHVCALPGSEIGLRLIGSLVSGAATAHVTPAYRTHGEAFSGAAIPPAAAESVLARGGTVILANPNNPDGRVIPPERLVALADVGGTLVVDEAFADVDPAISVAGAVHDDRRLIVLRSFGKFFGLAGVRLGFAIGPEAVIAPLRGLLGSWPVSAAAIGIGIAAYGDVAWIDAMRERLRGEAVALDAVLARHDLDAIGDCPLFRLIETDDAAALFERLARRRILTRPFDYDPRWLRIGLPGSAEGLARLDEALSHG